MLRMMLPIYFHSQHKGNVCFSLKWAGGGDVGLGEVGWICHHLAPAEAWFLHSLGADERFMVLGEQCGTQGWAGAGTCPNVLMHGSILCVQTSATISGLLCASA